MSADRDRSAGSPVKEDPERLVLRGKPRPVVRFRRGLIVGLTGAVAALLVGLSWFALQPASFHKAAAVAESEEQQGKAPPDTLSSLPRNYGDVPRLGPPLPGDLGRPILEHERSLDGMPPSESSDAGAAQVRSDVEVERQRNVATRTAARSSPVLVELDGDRVGAQPAPLAATQTGPAHEEPSSSTAGISASQQHKIGFAKGGEKQEPNHHQLSAAPSPWTLSEGTVIAASLITGLNSDLPGIVLAQVTENVRDSATGRVTLIPQGSRLVGRYDSAVAFGQRRALLVWTRIVLPDGSSIDLDAMPASDRSGYAGLEDKVDSHTWQLLKGVMLSTLLGVGTQLSFGSRESDIVRAIRESAEQNVAHAGDQIVSRDLDVQPTIRVRPGWPVRAIVNKDLVLQPWTG